MGENFNAGSVRLEIPKERENFENQNVDKSAML